jgi:hypothetical protein
MTAVGEVILAVAEGATGGLMALRGAGLCVDVDAFDVEVDFEGGPHDGGEVSATLRLRLVAQAGGQPMRVLAQPS